MAIALLEVSTFSKIPAFVPFGVIYYTQDTQQLYVGTGSSSGAAVTSVGAGGSTADTVVSISANQILSAPTTANLYVDATAGAGGIDLTLFSAVGYSGRLVRVVMIDTGIGGVTIDPVNGEKIDGGTTYVLTNQWQTVTMESNGANWRIVAVAG